MKQNTAILLRTLAVVVLNSVGIWHIFKFLYAYLYEVIQDLISGKVTVNKRQLSLPAFRGWPDDGLAGVSKRQRGLLVLIYLLYQKQFRLFLKVFLHYFVGVLETCVP